MTLSLYNSSIPLFQRALRNLSAILGKAADHAASGGVAEADLIAARLAPDMLAFPRQIQIASDGAKSSAARLAGLTPPGFPDTEASLSELQARIAKTLDFLETISPAAVDDRTAETITLKLGGNEISFVAEDFLRQFALPNFYFHVVTAYDLLRHKGVPLGKSDYLGSFK